MKRIADFLSEGRNASDVDAFVYDLTWHDSVGFGSKKECIQMISGLKDIYGMKSRESFDSKRGAKTVTLTGVVDGHEISIVFYPDGDSYNDPWCDLIYTK